MIGRVYKIYPSKSKEGEIYIGSTTQRLDSRFSQHICFYKAWKNGKRYKTKSYDLFEKYGIDSCVIELVQEYKIVDRLHLRVYEQLWLNKYRTMKDIKVVNASNAFGIICLSVKEYQKEYYEKNKEKIKEQIKEYYEENKEDIIPKMKEYYKNNREKILLQKKEYRENNREKINQTIKCDICEIEMNKKSLSRHKKTQHQL